MQIRPEIQIFAEAMEVVMQKHDKKKGDSWKRMYVEDLQILLSEEIEELPKGVGKVGEYVDVANFCMMLWWTHLNLPNPPLTKDRGHH